MSTGNLPLTPRRPMPPQAAGARVAWQSWILRDELGRTLRMLGAMLLCGALVWVVTLKIHLAVLAVAALVIAAWHLWIPRQFAIDILGLESTVLGRTRRIGWHAIRRVEMMDQGILFWVNRSSIRTGRKKTSSVFVPYRGDRAKIKKAIGEFIATTSSGNSTHAKKHAT
jgi:hypothetical protein